MFKFLKNLFGSKPEAGQWVPELENKELPKPQHTVSPAPKSKKTKAPKNPPKPSAKVIKLEEAKAAKKRGRPAKPKA